MGMPFPGHPLSGTLGVPPLIFRLYAVHVVYVIIISRDSCETQVPQKETRSGARGEVRIRLNVPSGSVSSFGRDSTQVHSSTEQSGFIFED